MKMKRILQNFRKSGVVGSRDNGDSSGGFGTADLTGRSTSGGGGDTAVAAAVGSFLAVGDGDNDDPLPPVDHLTGADDHHDFYDDDTSLYTTTIDAPSPAPPPLSPLDAAAASTTAARQFALFTEDKKEEEDRELSAFLQEQAAEAASRAALSASFSSLPQSTKAAMPEQKPSACKARAVTVGATTTTTPRHRPAPLQQNVDVTAWLSSASSPSSSSSPAAATGSSATPLPPLFPPDRYAETRDLVKKFIADIWNRGELDLIPSVCSPSLRFNGNTGFDRIGHDGLAKIVKKIRDSLDDYHCEIHSMVVEDNKCFCRLRFTGKHVGDLLGVAPTYRTVAWMGATEFTCQNGKILKVWELGDLRSLEEQLKQGVLLE